ncbi:hypothetical protein [Levilactobacillus brevis]|uniref:hypothetical protein n=1 Tax=Levilactobacillus brevis TaxID=1580 RepID=UPI000E08FBA8|nr:hypothetical protein [Levilactobacillus brevis]RDG03647.1 hypothetical protein DQM21_08505 [Levilactobacillus brevis]
MREIKDIDELTEEAGDIYNALRGLKKYIDFILCEASKDDSGEVSGLVATIVCLANAHYTDMDNFNVFGGEEQ